MNPVREKPRGGRAYPTSYFQVREARSVSTGRETPTRACSTVGPRPRPKARKGRNTVVPEPSSFSSLPVGKATSRPPERIWRREGEKASTYFPDTTTSPIPAPYP